MHLKVNNMEIADDPMKNNELWKVQPILDAIKKVCFFASHKGVKY